MIALTIPAPAIGHSKGEWMVVSKNIVADIVKVAAKNDVVKNHRIPCGKNGNKSCLQNQRGETLWPNLAISMTWLVNHAESIGRNRDALLFPVGAVGNGVGAGHSISDPCGWLGIFGVLVVVIPGELLESSPGSSDCLDHSGGRSSPDSDSGHNGKDVHRVSSTLAPMSVKNVMDLS